MLKIPIEIWRDIFDLSSFREKIAIRQISYDLLTIPIIDLYHIEDFYLERITDEVLKQHPQIRYLFAFDNPKITKVDHLEELEILDASWGCGIDSKGFGTRKIKALDITGNAKIELSETLADHIRDVSRGLERWL